MTTTGQQIAGIAESQVGTTNGSRYTNGRSEAWCGDFAKWCLGKVGLGGEANPYVPTIVKNAQNNGTWHARGSGYTPQAGDLITFDWNHDGTGDHVGVVTGVNPDGTIRVVSGNSTGYGKTGGESSSSGAVTEGNWNLNNADIQGFVQTPGDGGANVPGSPMAQAGNAGQGGAPAGGGGGADAAGLTPLGAGQGGAPAGGAGGGAPGGAGGGMPQGLGGAGGAQAAAGGQGLEQLLLMLEELIQELTGNQGVPGGGAPAGGGGVPAGGGGASAGAAAGNNAAQGAGGGAPNALQAAQPGNAPTAGLQGVLNRAYQEMNHPTQNWNMECLGFVNAMSGGKDPDLQAYDAKDAMKNAQADGRLSTDWNNMPAGAAVFWGGGQYGHVAIYSGQKDAQGNPLFISSTGWGGMSGIHILTNQQIGMGNPAGYLIPRTN